MKQKGVDCRIVIRIGDLTDHDRIQDLSPELVDVGVAPASGVDVFVEY